MASTFSEKFREKWLGMSPLMRSSMAIVGLLSVLFIITNLFLHSSKGPKKPTGPVSVSNLLLPKPENVTPEALAAGTKANTDAIGKLQSGQTQITVDLGKIQQSMNTLSLAASSPAANAPLASDMAKRLQDLQEQIDVLQTAKSSRTNMPPLNGALPVPSKDGSSGSGAMQQSVDQANGGTDSRPRLRITGGDASGAASKNKSVAKAKPVAYVPAGSFFEAVLLNGMDAPTSQVAQKNPVPAVMRVKTTAVLPNRFRHDVKECFVLVSGFGVLSSERAQLRTETLSCVANDGKVLEAKLDGYVVGEDGRVGARGRLVSKQGQMIAKSLAAGVLSGFGQSLTPQSIPSLNLGSDSTVATQRYTFGTVAETGVAKGFSTAANSASQFFMEMAQQMTPVVEIDAGRKLSIVLIKGVELK